MIDPSPSIDAPARPPRFLDSTRGRYLLFAALYFSEGAPIGYIWWTLPTKLRASDIPLDRITTLTAFVAIPWALKFLWAPIVDALRGPRWGRRQWIIAAQIGMGLVLVPMFWRAPAESIGLATILFIIHAFFAATQDVAIDAYCIATVPEHERGAVNGWMQVGMLTSRAIFGGGILFFEQFWGAGLTLPLMLICIWSTTVLVFFAREPRLTLPRPGGIDKKKSTAPRQFLGSLQRAIQKQSTWLALLFAAIGGAAFEAFGAVLGPMLIDLNWTESDIGLLRAVPCVIAMALGALVGGFASDRVGRRASVAVTGALLAVCVALVAAVLAAATLDHATLGAVIVATHVLIGAFTAATYALFMDLTDPALGATQFSAYMGATNLCEAGSAFAVGHLAVSRGYSISLISMVAVSLAALFLLQWLQPARRGTSA